MLKGCIFDCDGVLIDTEKYHYLSWAEIMNELGGVLTKDDYLPLKSTGGLSVLKFCFQKIGQEPTEELLKKFREKKKALYLKQVEKLSEKDIIPGTKCFLRLLKENDVKTAVASSSVEAGNLLKKFGLYKYFDTVIDGNSGLPLKPSPDLFVTASTRLGLKPKECLVFEDSLAGIEAGKRGGFKCIGIGNFLNGIADNVIQDFSSAGIYLLND